jgi:hypothetical protein
MEESTKPLLRSNTDDSFTLTSSIKQEEEPPPYSDPVYKGRRAH